MATTHCYHDNYTLLPWQLHTVTMLISDTLSCYFDNNVGSEVKDFSIRISSLKNQIKKLVSRRQRLGDWEDWHSKISFSIEDI